MRKDFQIAILLALAAIPAGVALMAAREYIGVLKEYPAPFFWGGLILAAGLIGAAIVIALRGEASEPRSGHRRRMIALVGMIIFGLGFIGSAAVYFWPKQPTKPEASLLAQNPPSYRTVKEAFLSDFRNLLNSSTERSITLSLPDGTKQAVTATMRIYYDFDAKTKFMAFYVPATVWVKTMLWNSQ